MCPDWNGRVMTSSCDGLDGHSFGLINVKEIDNDEIDLSYSFYGGEDQFTLSPEGGPFSLYYAVDHNEPTLAKRDHIRMPVGFQEGPFFVDSIPTTPEVRMRRSLHMTNLAGAIFDLDIVRTVRLMELSDIWRVFGDKLGVSLEQTDVSYVGFSTTNSVLNCGMPHSKLSGLVSVRIRSMFNSGQNTVAVIPYRQGSEKQLGPPACADFFGAGPHGQFRMIPEAALLRADSRFRCQIGVSRKRALPFLGAIDFREGALTLIAFDLPEAPWEQNYLCNAYCETVSNTVADFVNAREYYVIQAGQLAMAEEFIEPSDDIDDDEAILEVSRVESPDSDPYSGEVVRAYNHGPSFPGEVLSGRFYEFDVFSPARELRKSEALTHRQYTLHINADNQTLAYLVQEVLGIDYEQVFDKMIK